MQFYITIWCDWASMNEIIVAYGYAIWHNKFLSTLVLVMTACGLFGNQPIAEPMLTYCQLDILEQTLKKGEVKSLIWVQIQAQSSALQTLTSTFPGHWAFTAHVSIWLPSQIPGEYTAAHMQLGARAYKSALAGTHLLLGREKQCSVKCLAQGHNKQMHRQGIELGTWPRS